MQECPVIYFHILRKVGYEQTKFRIWETPTPSTDADSSTNTIKSNPIRNTYPFLRVHAIHKSNPENLLVFNHPHRDDPGV